MSPHMQRSEVIVRLHRVMDGVAGLPSEDIANVESLIQVGELAVAFETLCMQLFEWEVPLTAQQVEELTQQMIAGREWLFQQGYPDRSPVQKAIRELAAKLDMTAADNGAKHPPKVDDSIQPVT